MIVSGSVLSRSSLAKSQLLFTGIAIDESTVADFLGLSFREKENEASGQKYAVRSEWSDWTHSFLFDQIDSTVVDEVDLEILFRDLFENLNLFLTNVKKIRRVAKMSVTWIVEKQTNELNVDGQTKSERKRNTFVEDRNDRRWNFANSHECEDRSELWFKRKQTREEFFFRPNLTRLYSFSGITGIIVRCCRSIRTNSVSSVGYSSKCLSGSNSILSR